jgi:tripeptide aminopeptidase
MKRLEFLEECMDKIDNLDLLNRFLSYVRIDTQSNHESLTCPSTDKQWDLIYYLERELREFGVDEVEVTEFGYVIAKIKSNSKRKNVSAIGFLAHVDTAYAESGKANPIVHRNYDGKKIVLPDDPNIVLDPEEIPLLKEKIGEDIITASGKTLLGADDKAGVAICMSLARHLMRNKEIPHGDVYFCFNPDEEIGRGVHKLDLKKFPVRAAYTLDSEHLGQIDYETFSADAATVTIKGVSAHPGSAKGFLVNAIRIANEFISTLPTNIFPEEVEGRVGFIHPVGLNGGAEEASIRFIIRDFEINGLEEKKALLSGICKKLRELNPKAKIDIEFKKQYRNMRYWLEKDMEVVDLAKQAIINSGLEPYSEAVRGGTDGSQLTEMGIPTPNIFTGFHNIHSVREWVSLQDMTKAVQVLVELVTIWEARS